MHQAPSFSPSLSELFPRLTALVEYQPEQAKVMLPLFEAYVVLGGPPFIQTHADLMQAFLGEVCGVCVCVA